MRGKITILFLAFFMSTTWSQSLMGSCQMNKTSLTSKQENLPPCHQQKKSHDEKESCKKCCCYQLSLETTYRPFITQLGILKLHMPEFIIPATKDIPFQLFRPPAVIS